jgi:hypothetical protein
MEEKAGGNFMTIATQIKLKAESGTKDDLLSIAKIYLDGDYRGWFDREQVFQIVKNGTVITVGMDEGPKLAPCIKGTSRYVRSMSDDNDEDHLLKLPHSNQSLWDI